jgi:hypothetical protein
MMSALAYLFGHIPREEAGRWRRHVRPGNLVAGLLFGIGLLLPSTSLLRCSMQGAGIFLLLVAFVVNVCQAVTARQERRAAVTGS